MSPLAPNATVDLVLNDSTRAEWCAAFVAAQSQLVNPPKSKTAKVKTKSGADYSYTYAELPDIIDSVRLVLAEHGLAFTQEITGDPQAIAVTTTIYHSSGHSESFGPLLLAAGVSPQEAGSAITYGRRYHLCSVFGIAAEDDDDAATVKTRTKTSATSDSSDEVTLDRVHQASRYLTGTPPSHAGSKTDPRATSPSVPGSGTPSAPTSLTQAGTAESGSGGEAGVQGKGPDSPPDPGVCLHLNGTRTVSRATGGKTLVCIDCGKPVEVSV